MKILEKKEPDSTGGNVHALHVPDCLKYTAVLMFHEFC